MPSSAAAFVSASHALESFQARQHRRVNTYVNGVDGVLPPNGIRGRIFAAARAKTEAKNAAAMQALVKRHASVRERYELLWEQQWARRQSLASLASISESSGVMRFLASYVAGVPKPVLRLAREINSDTGPTAHLRIIFGDQLQALVDVAGRIYAISIVLAALAKSASVSSPAARALARDAEFALRDAALALAHDVADFVTDLDHVVAALPILDAPQPQQAKVAKVAAAAAAAASAAAAATAAAGGPSE
jgi:hypothetical protein